MIKVQVLIDKDSKDEVIHGCIREMLSDQPGAISEVWAKVWIYVPKEMPNNCSSLG